MRAAFIAGPIRLGVAADLSRPQRDASLRTGPRSGEGGLQRDFDHRAEAAFALVGGKRLTGGDVVRDGEDGERAGPWRAATM